jgi:hypothetical protein
MDARAYPVTVNVFGRSYSGSWQVEDGQVILSSAYGSDREPVSRVVPEKVAERLLREIVLRRKR